MLLGALRELSAVTLQGERLLDVTEEATSASIALLAPQV